MKINKVDGKYYDQHGKEVHWRHISDVTGLTRSESRLIIKKLHQTGAQVAPENLLKWRDDQVLMWKLENELGVVS